MRKRKTPSKPLCLAKTTLPTDPATNYAREVLAGEVPACKWVRLACERHMFDLEAGKWRWDEEEVRKRIKFFQLLQHYKGAQSGNPFHLEPWQEFVVGSTFGWKNPKTGLRRYRYVYLEVGRKNGKALALDTPIPTPTGWTTMGELEPGDVVFSEDGKPTEVLTTSEVFTDHDCYRVNFSNGESVVADAGHRWKLLSRTHGEVVITTEEMASTVHYGKRGDRRYSLRISAPLITPRCQLPVDPYQLGYWLGNGSSHDGTLSVGKHDKDFVLGEFLGVWRSDCEKRTCWEIRTTLKPQLAALGVLGNKHVPAAYLRASVEDRLAMLQGLMDSDGFVCKKGLNFEYCTTLPALRDGVCELLATLGLKYSCTLKEAPKCQTGVGADAYRILFSTTKDRGCPVRNPRKVERVRDSADRSARSLTVQVVSVERVPTVPTKCISVAAPSHLFLFGRTMLPTHNTLLAAGYALMGLLCGRSGMRPEPGAEVYAVATKEDQAKLVWRDAVVMAKHSPALNELVLPRLKELRFEAGDATFKPLGSDSLTLDGLNPYYTIMDELHAWRTPELRDVMVSGQGARADPLIIQITTAGFDKDGVCYSERDQVIKTLQGFRVGEADERYFGIIYTIDEEDDPWKEENWYKANPCLGIAKDLEYMRDEAARARLVPSKRNEFLTKHLDVWTQAEQTWIPVETWDRNTAKLQSAPAPGEKVVGSIDLASVGDIAALVWEWRSGGVWHFLPRFFIPEDNMRERVRKHRVPYDAWVRDGWLIATPGNVIDYDFIRTQVRRDSDAFRPFEIAYDPWNATDTVTALQGDGLNMVPCRQGFITMSPAMKALETEIVSGRVAHGGNPILRWMLQNVAVRKDSAGNIKPDKEHAREKIDGIVAMIMAHSRLMLAPAAKRSRYEDSGPLIL